MALRIVTWNMGCGFGGSRLRKHHDEAWAYLLDALRPDVALVQEAVFAKANDLGEEYTVALCDVGPGIDAGSAVLARGLQAQAIPAPLAAEETYIAAARISSPDGPFVAVSVHVNPGKVHSKALRSLVEKIGPALGDQVAVVAGDFNAARRFDEVYRGSKHRKFFEGMMNAGLHDAHWGKHGREVQSFWKKGEYQDDHVFVSKPWEPRIKSCDVVDNEIVRRISDHGPMVLELEVPAGLRGELREETRSSG